MTAFTPLSKKPYLAEIITIEVYRLDDGTPHRAEWSITGSDYPKEIPTGHAQFWRAAIGPLTLAMQRIENHYARQRRLNGGIQ